MKPEKKKEYDVLAKDDKERYDTEFTQVRRTDHSHRRSLICVWRTYPSELPEARLASPLCPRPCTRVQF